MTDKTPYDRRSPMEHERDDVAPLRKLIDAVEAGTATAPQMWDTLGRNSLHAIAAFNGSLDAAKALHEALLPGWFYCLMDCVAEVRGDMEYGERFVGKSTSTSSAWLLAILRAYEAQQ